MTTLLSLLFPCWLTSRAGSQLLLAQKTVHIPCHLAPFSFKPEMVIHASPASPYWLLLLQSARESALLLKSSWLVRAHPGNLPVLLINCQVRLPHHRVKSIKFMQGIFTGGQESLRITSEFFPPGHGTLCCSGLQGKPPSFPESTVWYSQACLIVMLEDLRVQNE